MMVIIEKLIKYNFNKIDKAEDFSFNNNECDAEQLI